MRILLAFTFLLSFGAQATLKQIFDVPGWEYISKSDLKKYENLWAISDVHGESEKLIRILSKTGLVESGCSTFKCDWTTPKKGARGQLLIVAGDNINKGPDSVGVVRLLMELQKQAKDKRGKVVLLLGNHEAELMANLKHTEKETKELEDSANDPSNRDWLELKNSLGKNIRFEELREESRFGKALTTFLVGVVVSDWLFAHSGYISSDRYFEHAEFIKLTGEAQQKGKAAYRAKDFKESRRNYKLLADEDEILSKIISERDWTQEKDKRKKMKERMNYLGIRTLVVGHDPGGLNDKGRIAIDDGWLMKLDTGLNTEMGYSEGRILKCPIPDHGELESMKDDRSSNCRQVGPESQNELPIAIFHD